ncbi:MAG TPA: DUF6603 domain-containing protein, partial [Nocardioides sp.]|nr:DUF6603 domain-containing protein [Nocardioides sp.]
MIDGHSLGSFGDLAVAIGLLTPTGDANGAWFSDPVTGGTSGHGLKYLLADDDQRRALVHFVDQILGPPDAPVREGATWVPLFLNETPKITVYAVVSQVGNEARLGLGLDFTTPGDHPPTLTARFEVPLFRFARRNLTMQGGGPEPQWLLLGREGGEITIGIDATLTDTTPTAGAASLGGASMSVTIPTVEHADLAFDLTLRDLQLPGAQHPETFALHAADAAHLGTSVLNLLAGLVRAQADALGDGLAGEFKAFADLAGLLGLRDVTDHATGTVLPTLPIADLPTQGVRVLVDWVESILADPATLALWLGQLADLVGGTVDATTGGISIPIGTATGVGRISLGIGVRLEQGTGSHPVLTPWVDLELVSRTAVTARAAVDLLRIDTATGQVTAIPDARIEGAFGQHSTPLVNVTGAQTLRIDTMRIGVALDAQHRPAFVLNATNVTLDDAQRDFVDLSSPDAALAAGADLVTGALVGALGHWGPAGQLVARLLGVVGTGSVPAISVPGLVADPVGTVRAHWTAVLQDHTPGGGLGDLLGRLSSLVRGVAAAEADGTGDQDHPWLVPLVDAGGVELRLEAWHQDLVLHVDAVAEVSRGVPGDLALASRLRFGVATLDLGTPSATFATAATLSGGLRHASAGPARLTLGPITLSGTELAVEASWRPATGLAVGLRCDDLALTSGTVSIGLPLPTIGPDGRLGFTAPDWDGIEVAVAALVRGLGLPELSAVIALVGWGGTGPHLVLGDLLVDPVTAIEAWLADLLLDCDVVRSALGPVVALLSGFRLVAPIGYGTPDAPYRCPVASEPAAPGLRVWLDPGCPPVTDPRLTDLRALLASNPPTGEVVATALRRAGAALPSIGDLVEGRDSLGTGLDQLLTRWRDCDGLVAQPSTLPSDVRAMSLPGRSYAELVALGRTGAIAPRVLGVGAGDVVHVGVEADVLLGRPDGTTYDLTGSGAVPTLPAGAGPWFVRLPTPTAAAAARPDLGGVGQQAALLTALLAERGGTVALVAYGAAGAAALRTAASVSSVTDVVTVGAPWSDVPTAALGAGLSGDALQLLRRLQRRTGVPTWSDDLLGQQCTPLQRVRMLVDRSVTATAADLPRCDAETRRTGLRVAAVFGALDRAGLATGLGAYVADAIDARVPQADPSDPDPEQLALHVALDVPVLDLDLGGLLVGAGAVFEACQVTHGGSGIAVALARSLTVELHLGIHDGWLVGGPSSTDGSADVRWAAVKVTIPFDGSAGSSQVVLHEAQGLGVDRETWIVTADAAVRAAADAVDAAVTAAVPEVRVLLGDVLGRLRAASPGLATLVDRLALVDGTGGLDLTGFDRFLHDPAATLRGLVATAPADLAGALRSLIPGATGSGTSVLWTTGDAQLGVDLGTGAITAGLHTTAEGVLDLALDVTASPTAAHGTVSFGTIDPALGGLRVVAESPHGGVPASIRVEAAAAGAAPTTTRLWPNPDTTGLERLVVQAVPGIALDAVLGALRTRLDEDQQALYDAALQLCGLLQPRTYGAPVVHVPAAFLADPAAYVVALGRSAGGDLAAHGVALLDALGHAVLPTPPAQSGTWQLVPGVVELRYATTGQRLEVTLHAELDETLGTVTIASSLDAGVVLAPGVRPAPAVGASVLVDGIGLGLHVDPDLRVELVRTPPLAPLPLYPHGPGLGQAFETAAESLLPVLLNRVADLGSGPAGLAKDVGQLVAALGDGLDLRDAGQFTAARIATFAHDPGLALLSHLAPLAADLGGAVANALNGATPRVTVTQAPSRVTFGFGTAPDTVAVTLDATTPLAPVVELAGSWHIDGVGEVRVEHVRMSAAGVAVSATLGPIPVTAGPVTLRPLLTVAAGSAATDRMLALGLALDDTAARSVEVRWGLDSHPPTLVAVDRTTGLPDVVDEPGGPLRLLAVGVGMASGVLLHALADALPSHQIPQIAVDLTKGVLLAETSTPATAAIDPGFVTDLIDPTALLHRAQRLLWNAATSDLHITVDGMKIGLAAEGPADDKQIGLSVTMTPATARMRLPGTGDTVVELEVVDYWIDPPVTPSGITIYAVHGTRSGDTYAFSFQPGITVAGVGLRFTKSTGPLLELGPVAIDGIAVRTYAQADHTGGGGGAQVALLGFAIAPAGGSGNAVASGILSDAGQGTSPAQRPTFDPSIAIQKHPGHDLGVRVDAGPPPGPWWIVVQRQLGPLYVERIGIDEADADGHLTRIALLFDGGVSLFGLNAQVDQLSLAWNGPGDLLDIHHWQVDLMGLAVSAELSGASLAGGLLKTMDGGVPAYVGMLVGRFGVYGLSVFGGYTTIEDVVSFFVFGAFNGPIGGPPAFFLTGIGGGLGINRGLVIPTDPARMGDFPFVAALDPYWQPPAQPMTYLKSLAGQFPAELGEFWFAAGISFTCFSLVQGIAVVAVSFGDGLEIDLVGLARLALPNPAAPLVSIELGMLARFSTKEGLFLIQAALTDNSWLLYRDVRLTGGFAFATWWKGQLAGQFVLTIGGYHPDFHVDGYPVVPRVGLSWQVTSEIGIKGGSYFALCSEAVMAGVDVQAYADFGWAWAKADFGADGLVYFDPFWYDVDVHATISAGIDIDTWFGDISISITTGCGVHVWGPDFSGEASVEIGPCTVTVPFGANAKRPGAQVSWSGFVTKYLEDAGGGVARALSATTGRGTLQPATGGGQAAPTPDGSQDHPFEVYAEFDLTLVTTIPTTAFDLDGEVVAITPTRSDGRGASLGLSPMGVNLSESRVRVTLELLDAHTGWQDDSAALDLLTHSAPVQTGFPSGVWGATQVRGSTATPSALPSGDVINAGSQITLTADASVTSHPEGPQIDYRKVESDNRIPLPFTAGSAPRVKLEALAGGVTLPVVDSVATAVTAASGILFARRTAPDPATGLVPTGTRSRLAEASYARGLNGPPRFSHLTDGLAVVNADDVSSAPVDAPPAPEPPRVKDPRVVAVLAAGTNVALRASGTTVDRVAPERPKRRAAPTTASVQARLGAHLPVSLAVAVPSAAAVGTTVAPTAVPLTRVPSSARSFALGDAGALSQVAGLTGFGGAPPPPALNRKAISNAQDPSTPTGLASGDVVVLDAPDHGVDTGDLRPTLELGGAARVVFVRGDGRVLLDEEVQGVVEVPVGTATIGVQADGRTDVADGCSGWHARSAVAALGPGAAMAAGAVIVVDVGLHPIDAGWTTAGAVVRDAARVLTRFSKPVRTVAVVVDTDDPQRLGDLGLQLQGAARDGDPHLVMNGTQAVVVYDVVPDPAAETVAVAVAPGGGWRIAGVLGSDLSAE